MESCLEALPLSKTASTTYMQDVWIRHIRVDMVFNIEEHAVGLMFMSLQEEVAIHPGTIADNSIYNLILLET